LASLDRVGTPHFAAFSYQWGPSMRSSLGLWILFGLIVLLPVTTSARAEQHSCDFRQAAQDLIQNHDALRTANRALIALREEVPRYAVNGSFFPATGSDGESGNEFKEDIIKQFNTADSDFKLILVRVIVARNRDCELCELKYHYYRRAEQAGFPSVTKEQLRKRKGLFLRAAKQIESIRNYEIDRQRRLDSGGSTGRIDDLIADARRILSEETHAFREEYERTRGSEEARAFAREMEDTKDCEFLPRDEERRRREDAWTELR
jgi:hypothetical protein